MGGGGSCRSRVSGLGVLACPIARLNNLTVWFQGQVDYRQPPDLGAPVSGRSGRKWTSDAVLPGGASKVNYWVQASPPPPMAGRMVAEAEGGSGALCMQGISVAWCSRPGGEAWLSPRGSQDLGHHSLQDTGTCYQAAQGQQAEPSMTFGGAGDSTTAGWHRRCCCEGWTPHSHGCARGVGGGPGRAERVLGTYFGWQPVCGATAFSSYGGFKVTLPAWGVVLAFEPLKHGAGGRKRRPHHRRRVLTQKIIFEVVS